MNDPIPAIGLHVLQEDRVGRIGTLRHLVNGLDGAAEKVPAAGRQYAAVKIGGGAASGREIEAPRASVVPLHDVAGHRDGLVDVPGLDGQGGRFGDQCSRRQERHEMLLYDD